MPWFHQLVVVLLLAGSVVPRAKASEEDLAPPQETKAEKDARMKWWREARFGLFIHWGIYSVPAGIWNGKPVDGTGEWIMHNGRIPVAEYARFASRFNPVKFNAEEWVELAKKSGMKYIIITSKHHDGFAMFGSKASPYNIVDDTPFHRDPLKELAAACQKRGIKLGFYYSQAQDWHHPGGASFGGHWDPAQDGSMDDYLKNIAMPQVREILANYGPIAVLWWDTPADMTRERAAQFLPLLKLQPGIITNNRLGVFPGDTETPEQFVPATGFPGRDWETCMTMNDTWGFKSNDQNWKPVDVLIRTLVDIASKGGNYLLNVGPTSEGQIPQPSVERLLAIGKWLGTNGEAIYGTSASPFKRLAWGRCTAKPGKLYLHIFDWPADGKIAIPMLGKVTRAYLLAARESSLPVEQTPQAVAIQLPPSPPDPVASVVVAEVEGGVKPVVVDATTIVPQARDGSIKLRASDAEIDGETARIETSGLNANVGFWTNPQDTVRWKARITQPGAFQVDVVQACETGTDGTGYAVKFNDQEVAGTVVATGDWRTYKTVHLGRIKIEGPGTLTVRVIPRKPRGYAVMNLRAVELTPATN
jgi:alpha-L-fucosidase